MNSSSNSVSNQEYKVRVVAKAICKFNDGTEYELYATKFSLSDVFIMSVRPPSVGAILNVSLFPLGLEPLPPARAIVVAARLDPGDISNSGFEARFTDVTKEYAKFVTDALESLGLPTDSLGVQPQLERRVDPRVSTGIVATIESLGHCLKVRVENLSMSGALVAFEEETGENEITKGALVNLGIVDEGLHETLYVKAEIARVMGEDKLASVGVKFLDVDDEVLMRIEKIILATINNEL